MTDPVEVVLPDGGFARIYPVLVKHLGIANLFPPEQFMAALIACTVTIDDNRISVEEVLDMEFETAMPIYEVMTAQMKRAVKTKDGVA